MKWWRYCGFMYFSLGKYKLHGWPDHSKLTLLSIEFFSWWVIRYPSEHLNRLYTILFSQMSVDTILSIWIWHSKWITCNDGMKENNKGNWITNFKFVMAANYCYYSYHVVWLRDFFLQCSSWGSTSKQIE